MYSVHEDVVALSVDVLAHYEKMRWLLVWMYWLIMRRCGGFECGCIGSLWGQNTSCLKLPLRDDWVHGVIL